MQYFALALLMLPACDAGGAGTVVGGGVVVGALVGVFVGFVEGAAVGVLLDVAGGADDR